jgi:hypothetical protein
VKEVEVGGAYSTYGKKKNLKERSLGKSKIKWKDNINVNLK